MYSLVMLAKLTFSDTNGKQNIQLTVHILIAMISIDSTVLDRAWTAKVSLYAVFRNKWYFFLLTI